MAINSQILRNPIEAIPHDMRPKLIKKPGVFNPVPPKTTVVTTTPPPTDPNGGFYPFNDYYGGLLTKLANIRDLSLAGLSSDLENRSKNVQGIVDAARAPLNAGYSQAEQEAAAVNDAVANRLQGQGSTATDDLRSKLASLGQDPTAATQDLGKYYSGTVGANYALDSGDVQRLIGRQAEENTLLNKQPALIRTQMEGDLATNQGNVIGDYMDKAFTLSGQQADAQSQYAKDKFAFQQQTAATAAAAKKDSEATYWNNYWNKQDLRFKRWQTQIASGDKAAANQTKKEIDAANRQSAVDIANIRAGATTTAAETRAAATKAAAVTRANATKSVAGKAKAVSNVNKQRAYQAAVKAVIDPKTNLIVRGVNPTGYNSDWTMTRIIHSVLKSYGINPQTPQGRSVTASVMSQAAGHAFASDNTARYHYDPNWVKGAKATAKKKNRGK